MFLLIVDPCVLQSDNGFELTAYVVREMKGTLATSCALQAPREAQSQGSVEQANSGSLKTTPEIVSLVLRFVHNQKNLSYHSGIKNTPYATLLGENPKDGLSSTSLLQEVIGRLETEDDLASLGAQPPPDPAHEPLEALEPVIITTQPSYSLDEPVTIFT
ncbi:KRAB-A domain-containing protein 2-like [Palaemon carinicauda]|uniref:KRAB-A domain-containing protein 2-like n=1 Tax=Palaemon carinicauda TaxID=392227 RepID=UPI0035B5F810